MGRLRDRLVLLMRKAEALDERLRATIGPTR